MRALYGNHPPARALILESTLPRARPAALAGGGDWMAGSAPTPASGDKGNARDSRPISPSALTPSRSRILEKRKVMD